MITFKEYLLESSDLRKLEQEFIKHYKEDPGGVIYQAKVSYLDVLSSAKHHSKAASELLAKHPKMSKQQFQDSIMTHFVTKLAKHNFPKHASKLWGDAEHEMLKEFLK